MVNLNFVRVGVAEPPANKPLLCIVEWVNGTTYPIVLLWETRYLREPGWCMLDPDPSTPAVAFDQNVLRYAEIPKEVY